MMLDYKQKFEPRGNKVIHGAGQSLKMFSEYWKAVEDYKPVIYMTYFKFVEIDKWIAKTKKVLGEYPDVILQIGVKMTKNSVDITKEISEGNYDKELDQFLETIKKVRNPVFIRIGYEFDWPGRFEPESFVIAWKYIVDYYRKKGINNIATVWCSCPYKGTAPVEPYYPGDNYVDWFGIDVFAVRHFKDSKYDPVENFLKLAKKHKKPVMVGESTPARVGVDNGKESWDEWFKPYFKWIKDHPIIKAFCYINWDWEKDYKKPEWGNGRIHENEIVRKNFVKELKKKKYIHNKPIKNFLKEVYQ